MWPESALLWLSIIESLDFRFSNFLTFENRNLNRGRSGHFMRLYRAVCWPWFHLWNGSLRLFPTVSRVGAAYFDPSGLSMDRAGSTISDAPMVDGAGRSPCAGLTFTENAVLDSGNEIILNGTDSHTDILPLWAMSFFCRAQKGQLPQK